MVDIKNCLTAKGFTFTIVFFFCFFFQNIGKQLSNFKLLTIKSFQLIHNLISLILFIFCPETVVCFHICCM